MRVIDMLPCRKCGTLAVHRRTPVHLKEKDDMLLLALFLVG